ncbi:MAG TPA: hypothetical protein V6C76_10660 [Drouetiella sp.]
MRLATLAIVLVAVTSLICPSAFSAVPTNIKASLRLANDSVVVGDVLHMTVAIRNTTAADCHLNIMVPYISYPELKAVGTESRYSWWAPPYDGPVVPKSILLKPGQDYTLFGYTIKTTAENTDGMGAAALGRLLGSSPSTNTGLLSTQSGTFTVKFKLSLDAVNVETEPKTFRVEKR